MCGIFAALSFRHCGLFKYDYEVFTDLAKVSLLRGMDGGGVFYVGDKKSGLYAKDGDNYVSWIKKEGPFTNLMVDDIWKDHENDFMRSRFLVGHARWATQGKRNTDHAHPFEHEHITMVHNGTLESIKNQKPWGTDGSDSLELCKLLASGPPKKVIPEFRGPTALVWYDNKDKKLRLWRNYGRTLFGAFDFSVIYLASEMWMLENVIKRKTQVRTDLRVFEENYLYEWDHNEIKPHKIPISQFKETRVIPAPQQQPLALPKPSAAVGAHKGLLDKVVDALRSPAKSVDKDAPPPRYRHLELVHDERTKTTLIPAMDYMSLKRGDKVIFEPTHIEYLDNGARGLIKGEFIEALPIRAIAYGMFDGVQIIGKTKKKDKTPPNKVYSNKLLVGDVESILINSVDSSDVRVHVVSLEPYSESQLETLRKMKKGKVVYQ